VLGYSDGQKEVRTMSDAYTTEIRERDIEALSREAAEAGDSAMTAICVRALNGSERDWIECERVILQARAQS
jgi:hypothetical protein